MGQCLTKVFERFKNCWFPIYLLLLFCTRVRKVTNGAINLLIRTSKFLLETCLDGIKRRKKKPKGECCSDRQRLPKQQLSFKNVGRDSEVGHVEMSVGREIYRKFIEKFSVELPDADRFCYFLKLFYQQVLRSSYIIFILIKDSKGCGVCWSWLSYNGRSLIVRLKVCGPLLHGTPPPQSQN